MNTERINYIAQIVQNAFWDIMDKLNKPGLSEELLQVIKLLPVDKYNQMRGKNADFRLCRFPDACCADGAYVLSALLNGLNASCFLGISKLEVVHAVNPQNTNIDHYWVRCDGVSYDVTYGQFDSEYNKRVLIGEHPFSDWNIEIKPIQDVALAEYINSAYIRWCDDDNRSLRMILPKVRDKRFITIRRGGTLTDENHRLLAVWAAKCASHVLHYFEQACPDDERPRRAIEAAHAWVNGEITMTQAKFAAGASQDAAKEIKEVSEAARMAALSAGQAAVVAHVAAHELGAAAYAIRAVMAASPKEERDTLRQQECQWQRDMLPEQIRELVLDDERLRNDICWCVFGEDL